MARPSQPIYVARLAVCDYRLILGVSPFTRQSGVLLSNRCAAPERQFGSPAAYPCRGISRRVILSVRSFSLSTESWYQQAISDAVRYLTANLEDFLGVTDMTAPPPSPPPKFPAHE